ncbi:hypothetical protein BE20_45375 [Sorangium cellulosum]|nr:hypothetical protein BE20_45375 [Sorangium cellulosum]
MRSRWTTPFSCTACIAAATGSKSAIARSGAIPPSRASTLLSDSPSMSSITRYGSPSAVSPRSKIRTISAWFSLPAARASRRKYSFSSADRSSGRISLIATSDPTTTLVATQTVPIAPSPILRASRYLPATRSPSW